MSDYKDALGKIRHALASIAGTPCDEDVRLLHARALRAMAFIDETCARLPKCGLVIDGENREALLRSLRKTEREPADPGGGEAYEQMFRDAQDEIGRLRAESEAKSLALARLKANQAGDINMVAVPLTTRIKVLKADVARLEEMILDVLARLKAKVNDLRACHGRETKQAAEIAAEEFDPIIRSLRAHVILAAQPDAPEPKATP